MTKLAAGDGYTAPRHRGAAKHLNVSERFIRRLIEEHRITYIKVGKYIRFDADDLERWIETRKVQPTQARRTA